MINIIYVFWMYVLIFTIIGAMRGWAKEILVSFSMILALALNHLLFKYIPMIYNLPLDSTPLFWTRSIITIALVYFGYQTVGAERFSGKARKEKLQDAMLGGVMGALNGYLVVGTIWSYLYPARAAFDKVLMEPGPELSAEIARMVSRMPPGFFGDPGIYFAVIIAFIFIIVVYV